MDSPPPGLSALLVSVSSVSLRLCEVGTGPPRSLVQAWRARGAQRGSVEGSYMVNPPADSHAHSRTPSRLCTHTPALCLWLSDGLNAISWPLYPPLLGGTFPFSPMALPPGPLGLPEPASDHLPSSQPQQAQAKGSAVRWEEPRERLSGAQSMYPGDVS